VPAPVVTRSYRSLSSARVPSLAYESGCERLTDVQYHRAGRPHDRRRPLGSFSSYAPGGAFAFLCLRASSETGKRARKLFPLLPIASASAGDHTEGRTPLATPVPLPARIPRVPGGFFSLFLPPELLPALSVARPLAVTRLSLWISFRGSYA
jgi:hypothetical protein